MFEIMVILLTKSPLISLLFVVKVNVRSLDSFGIINFLWVMFSIQLHEGIVSNITNAEDPIL